MSKNPRETNRPDYSGWKIIKNPATLDLIGLTAILVGISDCTDTINRQVTQQVPPISQEQLSAAQTAVAKYNTASHELIKRGETVIVVPQITDPKALSRHIETVDNARERPKQLEEAKVNVIENGDVNYRAGSVTAAGILFLAGGIILQVRNSRRTS